MGGHRMNVYDFDGTIFPSNCTVSFGAWCVRHHPTLSVTYGPKVVWSFAKYKRRKIANYQMQRELFAYLTMIDDFDTQIERYWDVYEKKIAPWYLAQKRPDDLIITSSPSCIIGPIARRLGVNYAATEFDREMGVFVDNLMYAKEKARYIFDLDFPRIEHFYSDSLTDTPLALCAEHAHLVTHNASVVTDWPALDPETIKRVKKELDTGWNIHLTDF